MMYIYYCDAYIENVTPQVDKIVRRKLTEYATRPSLKGIKSVASYTGKILVLNISNPHHKVILEEERVIVQDEECHVCFVRDIISMGQNYNWLQTYVEIRDGKWQEYNPLLDYEVAKFKENFLLSKHQITQKSQPPARLTEWHQNYKLKVEYDIYEAESWVKFALSTSIADGMIDDEVKLYSLVLNEIIKDHSTIKREVLKITANSETYTVELNNMGVIYSRVIIDGKTVWLLHNGANIKTQSEHWNESKEKVVEQSGQLMGNIQRIALKAYPSWTLKDPELWKAIQKNKETGNLSLLHEQTIFLKDFAFPKYINGQAGSGKSTMLYYLFANAYYYKCFGEIKGDIIFLTENEELLKHTKSSVIELLQCNPEFELSLDDISNVDYHFSSFKRFLLEQLPEDNTDFPPEKYLDFSKFKILYEASNVPNHTKERYSAELVWFSISTYILGYDIDFQITHNNYDKIMPWEGKQLISHDDLVRIETTILPFYRKLIDNENYWDKIKIIKYLRNNVPINKSFEVIFCDEAQDFSRVELQFILGLSEYINYDLSQTTQVPIVFAGDALQTVNPTGFRSAEVKDMLYKELKEIAGFDLKTDKIEYSPSYNYRSSQPIVNVANAIQYHRKNEFTSDIKTPQIAKRPEIGQDAHINVFIDYATLINSPILQTKLEFKTFIIPSNVDEKEAYIEKNSVLKKFGNIKSAVEAKGIDYDQVVLFGFGEYAINIPQADEYERRFFYNKLYVGVTRAQYELVIIDAKETETSFWNQLIGNYAESNWADKSEVDRNTIKNTICYGAEQIPLVMQSTPELAFENATKDKEQGIIDRNPSLLRVAASQFLRLGVKKEHFFCLALMYEYLDKWRDSANYYLKKEVGSDGFEAAANVYWQGEMLGELTSMNLKSPMQSIRLIVASLIINKNLQYAELRTLYDHRQSLRRLLHDTPWRQKIIHAFIEFLSTSIDDDQLKYLIDIFNEISSKTDKLVWSLIGEKNFYLNRFEAAIEAFENINDEGILFVKSHIEIAKRRSKISDVIFWKGRLVFQTLSPDERAILEDEIIELYQAEHSQIRQSTNAYTWLYVYFSFLLRAPFDGQLFEIAQSTEKLFAKKESELVYNYFNLLKSQRLHPSITNFVISRWAKNCYKTGTDLAVINEDYKQVVRFNKVKHELFSDTEIKEIPDYPDRILAAPPCHFATINIKNFRSFNDIKIENLGLFNLILGDNNIGKTSFLEALLFSPNKKEYLNRLAFAYIERRNVPPDKEETSAVNRLFYKLSNGFLNDFKNNNEKYFQTEVTLEGKRSTWKYKIQKGEDVANNNILLDSYSQNLTFNDSDYSMLLNLDFMDGIKQPFMPYGKGYSYDLAQAYFEEIGTKPKAEEKFLNDMKIFIPKIKRIVADTKNGVIEILDEDFPDEFTPLHQYGEGANKLFRILILLSLHKGKKVLIDEFDAGIHYTRFKKFWKTILEIAGNDQTQIFVTTHNDECIQYFADVLAELGIWHQHQSRVVQLKKVNQAIKIRSYEFDSFSLAIKDSVELRGGFVA